MIRAPARTALAGLILALALLCAIGCLGDDASSGQDGGMTSQDTRNDDTSAGQLSSVILDNLELPDPGSEGPLCVTLAADTSMTLDTVSVETTSNSDPVHTFTNVSVSPDGIKNCTTACFCLGPNPPAIQLELKMGDHQRTLDSGQSAPSGCCESM